MKSDKQRVSFSMMFTLTIAGLLIVGTTGALAQMPTPAPGEAVGLIFLDGLGGIHTISREGGPLVNDVADEIKDLTAEDPVNGSLPDLFFGFDIARDLALTPDQDGFWVLDGYGALHAYGNAVAPLALDEAGTQYFYPGFDIARDVEAGPDSAGAFILDGYGALHAVGSARDTAFMQLARPYFGWDIARDIEVTPGLGGFAMLDGFGAVHFVGDAASLYQPAEPAVYFGWDIAKDLEFPLDGATGFYVLDGFGGVHTMGAARMLPTAYFGWDVAEDVEQLFFPDLVDVPDHGGIALWQLDAFGGVHPTLATGKLHDITNNMVRFSLDYYLGWDIVRDFEVVKAPGSPAFPTPTFTPTLTATPTETSFIPTFTPTATFSPTPTATETSFAPDMDWRDLANWFE